MSSPFPFKSIAAAAGLAVMMSSPASAYTLFGETLNATIQIAGMDDNGFYTIDVLNGPVSVGAGGFTQTYHVFQQLTQGGFATASNRIVGDVTLTIGADTVSVRMAGQVQPYLLSTSLSGIGGSSFIVTGMTDSATGLMDGVNMDWSHNFSDNSIDFATYYLGFQPGTDVTQTETLTFGPAVTAAVPEPATWAMMLAGFGGLALMARRRRKAAAA